MDDAVDAADPRLAGVRPSQLSTRNAVQMTGPDGNPLVLFDNVFPTTPSGKIELKSETLAKRWGAAALLPGWRERKAPHPLMLISPSSDKRISSTLGGLIGSREAPPLLMNPKGAAQRSLGRGIEVRVWNDAAKLSCRLR
jgi:anaerobic selenocysteine-containing dehydrogenase